MLMRTLVIAFLIIFSTTSQAQRLALKNGHFIVLYADEGASVNVRETSVLAPGEKAFDYSEFIVEKGRIKSRILFNGDKSSEPYEEGLHHQWPEHVKINNNGDYVETKDGDSLVYDKKRNITEVYSAEGGDNKRKTLVKKFFYIGNYEVYEMKMEETNGYAQLYLYKLDANGNILSRLFAEADQDMKPEEMNEEDIRWKEEIEFIYLSKKENLPVRINWYKFSGGSRSLTQYQNFVTARHKVTNSKIFEKAPGFQTLIYDQRYNYSNW
jgi:hypothetical protein